MRSTLTRAHAVKALATVVLVAGAAGVAGIGTFGAYTDTTTADIAVSAAEKVDVRMNGEGGALSVPASGMVPGDQVAMLVSLTRAPGSAELATLQVSGTASQTNDLSRALRLDVERCSVPWTGATCAGTVTQVHGLDSPTRSGATTGTAPAAWLTSAGWVADLNADRAVHLRVVLELPDNAAGEAAQGQSTTLRYTLLGTQRAGRTTTVVPTAQS